MPAAIFTDPEIATVGLSEAQAKEQGREVKVGKFPFAASGRAMSVRHTEGFVKTVVDAKDNRLLGVSIVGPGSERTDRRANARPRDVCVRRRRRPDRAYAPHVGGIDDGVLQSVTQGSHPHHESVNSPEAVHPRARHWAVFDLGRAPYGEVHELQQELLDARTHQRIGDTILVVEHEPVITLGRGAKIEHLLGGRAVLAEQGIEVHEIGRGGDVTYHGPGQLVVYPIVDLSPDRRDVRKYVASLEEAMIRCVGEFGIQAGRLAGLNGTWVLGSGSADRKIGAVGVRISRWVTMHGMALNVATELEHFRHIVPCGIRDKAVTSIAAEIGHAPSFPAVARSLVGHLASQYDASLTWSRGLPRWSRTASASA